MCVHVARLVVKAHVRHPGLVKSVKANLNLLPCSQGNEARTHSLSLMPYMQDPLVRTHRWRWEVPLVAMLITLLA